MRILVTGASGFLGGHLCRGLVGAGYEVHATRRARSSLARVSDVADAIHWHDLDRDPPEALFASGCVPDAVFHLATCYGREGEAAADVLTANTLFPLRLLGVAASTRTRLFVAADTCFTLAYGYLQAYTLSKRQFAEWGRLLASSGSLRFVNLRLQHPYGPGDSSGKFIPQLLHRLCSGEPEIALTPGEQRKDFIYVSDVVAAWLTLLTAAESLPIGFSQMDCGTGQAVSIRELVELAHEVSGSKSRLHFGALPYRENEIMLSQADTGSLRELGWRPRVTLEEGIASILRSDFAVTSGP